MSGRRASWRRSRRLRWGAEPFPGEVWVQLVARGEAFQHLLYSAIDADGPTDPASPIDPAAAAQNLAWELEDFVAESRFAWGQQRIARYDLPDLHIRDA